MECPQTRSSPKIWGFARGAILPIQAVGGAAGSLVLLSKALQHLSGDSQVRPSQEIKGGGQSAPEIGATPSSKRGGSPRRQIELFWPFCPQKIFFPCWGPRMEIQEGAAPIPSAPLQAGHARFWQRPSHISHRDSLGLSAPQIRPWQGVGSGLGPQELEEIGWPLTLPFSRPHQQNRRGPSLAQELGGGKQGASGGRR